MHDDDGVVGDADAVKVGVYVSSVVVATTAVQNDDNDDQKRQPQEEERGAKHDDDYLKVDVSTLIITNGLSTLTRHGYVTQNQFVCAR